MNMILHYFSLCLILSLWQVAAMELPPAGELKSKASIIAKKSVYEQKNTMYNDIVDLINNNEDLNALIYCRNGRTALGHAAFNNKLEEAALLLDHGADPNAAPTNETPLILAVEGGHPAMVKLLTSRGANPNIGPRFPLHTICYCVKDVLDAEKIAARLEMAHWLLENNADPELKDAKGNTPIFYLLEPTDFTACYAHCPAGCAVHPDSARQREIIFNQRKELIGEFIHLIKLETKNNQGKTIVEFATSPSAYPFLGAHASQDAMRKELGEFIESFFVTKKLI